MENSVDTTADEGGPEDTHQLHEDHVVGKDIRVACGRVGALLAPSFEAQVEDKDVERKEDEDADDGKDGDVDSAIFGSEAFVQEKIQAAATGGRGRKRGIKGGRGVD